MKRDDNMSELSPAEMTLVTAGESFDPILCWPDEAIQRSRERMKALPRDLITQTILGVTKALVMLDDEAKGLPEGAERAWVETSKARAIQRLRELHIQLEAAPR